MTVPATTLEEIFKNHSLSRIDRLYLDMEGLDADTLLSLNLSSYTIPYIAFEHGHTDGSFTKGLKWRKLLKHFNSHNYQPFMVFTHDLQFDYSAWAVRKDYLSFFKIGIPLRNEKGEPINIDGVPVLDARDPTSATLTVFRTEENNFKVDAYLQSL